MSSILDALRRAQRAASSPLARPEHSVSMEPTEPTSSRLGPEDSLEFPPADDGGAPPGNGGNRTSLLRIVGVVVIGLGVGYAASQYLASAVAPEPGSVQVAKPANAPESPDPKEASPRVPIAPSAKRKPPALAGEQEDRPTEHRAPARPDSESGQVAAAKAVPPAPPPAQAPAVAVPPAPAPVAEAVPVAGAPPVAPVLPAPVPPPAVAAAAPAGIAAPIGSAFVPPRPTPKPSGAPAPATPALTPPAAAIASAPQPVAPEPAATDPLRLEPDPAATPDGEAAEADELAKAEKPPSAAQETEVLTTPPEGSPQMFLLFIQWSDEPLRRVASLRSAGGRLAIVKEGDIVEGMKVMAIRRDAVEFQWRGSTFRVGPVRAAPPA